MIAFEIYVAIIASAVVSFFVSLVEATYLTVKRLSLFSMQNGGSRGASTALRITGEKTKLVTVTTFIDTVANVVLATSMGIALSEDIGPLGWLVSVVFGSVLIMIFLYLIPKTIGVENPVRMAVTLAPTTLAVINAMSPIAEPLAGFAKRMARRMGGQRTFREDEITEELETLIGMLEADGQVGPDAGRIIRSTLASSRFVVMDVATPSDSIVSVDSDATVMEALKVMGASHHPRIPVFDRGQGKYVGVITFRSLARGISERGLDAEMLKYMVQPAKVEADASVASAVDNMSSAGVTIAFVYQDGEMIGVITITDLLEQILGFKLS